MSALPHEPPTRGGYNPFRLAADEGPQTIAELKAQLRVVAPADREQFDVDLEAARLDQVPAVITEYRHVWALRTRPDIAAAIEAELAGTATTITLDLEQDA